MFCLGKWKYIVRSLITENINSLIKCENLAQAYHPFKPQVVCVCVCVYCPPSYHDYARPVDGHVMGRGRSY